MYDEHELQKLRGVHVHLPEVPLFRDVGLADEAVCDSGLLSTNAEPRAEFAVIHKGMRFPTLESLKMWLQDYAVRHHRPFTVVHSQRSKRYTVTCQMGCGWGVWARNALGDGKLFIKFKCKP